MPQKSISSLRYFRAGMAILCLAAPLAAAFGQSAVSKASPKPPVKTSPEQPAKNTTASGKQGQKQGLFDGRGLTAYEQTGILTASEVIYTEADMKVTGDKGRYNKNTRQLLVQGNLVMDDPKHHVTGAKADVDNANKIAIITENVVMVMKPAPDSANAKPDADVNSERKQGIIITCDYVKDNYKSKFVILKGHLIFRQKIKKQDGSTVERVLTAEHGEYNGATDKMHLFKPVKGRDSDGQTSDFEDDVMLGTKEGAETLETKGRTEIHINVDDSDNGGDGEAPPK